MPQSTASTSDILTGAAEGKDDRPRFSSAEVQDLVRLAIGDDLHAKRVLCLSNAARGVLAAASLSISAIGRGLARWDDLNPKHTTKQIDRLLGNSGYDCDELQDKWVEYIVGDRRTVIIAIDWTEFDGDGHSTIAANLLTSHGRATSLMWSRVEKSKLKRQRNRYESELLERLHAAMPPGVDVTILADRGLRDQKRYAQIDALGWYFVIRFRGGIAVMDEKGAKKAAKEWFHPSGRTRTIRNAGVTEDEYPLAAVVMTKAKGMKEAWFCATNRPDFTGAPVVKLYGKRFTIEENFRDTKDMRFWYGHVGHTSIDDTTPRPTLPARSDSAGLTDVARRRR